MTSTTTTLPTRVSLSTSDFETALAKYMDENKPDPLLRRQLEGWSLEWTNNDDCLEALSFTPSHVLSGRLQIGSGEYTILTLYCTCGWTKASLWYQCLAAVQFVTTKSPDSTKSHHEPSTKATKRRHETMIQRLSRDDYIAKLLVSSPMEVCQAHILQSKDNLEERVRCNQDAAEGIRRAILSQSASVLDVFDILLHLPSLPVTNHQADCNNGTADGNNMTTPLANRAKLRLLEDAMCDACEQEGEDELVSDLSLNPSSSSPSNNKRSRKIDMD